MHTSSTINQSDFRSILARTVRLPLAAGILSAIVFIGFMIYMLFTLEWVDHTYRGINYANEIATMVMDQQTSVRGYLISRDESYLQPFQRVRPKLARALPDLAEFVSDNPTQVNRVKRIQALHQHWESYVLDTITLVSSNPGENKQSMLYARLNGGRIEFDQIRSELGEFAVMEQSLLKTRTHDAKLVSYGGASLFLLFSLGLSIFLAVFGRAELLRLSRMYNHVLNDSNEQAEVLAQQAWQRTRQSELLESTTDQDSVSAVGNVLLDFLAKHINAVVGALYVREESGRLYRVATYGFSKESAAAAQSFVPGESLVGQAAQSRRVITLDNLPGDYLKVASGIGETAPKQVVMIPLEQNAVGAGVIELGFMQAISERELEFLNLIAPRIAATIESILSRFRLEDSLTETQQLNEELQAQQEELRAANEELEEQSRALEHSQSHLESQKSELERTNRILADQALSLDQKNAALNAAQTEIERRSNELERSSQYKSEFLANMSHELRTPLNSALILSKLLSDNVAGNLTQDQVKYANTIYAAGNDLLNLINDILDISKVEAGKLELYSEDISIGSILAGLRRIFDPIAQQKNLRFQIVTDEDLSDTFFSDRQRVEQILRNLLSNAIKFTDAGAVTLTVSSDRDGTVHFAVEDTGIGIPENQLRRVFEAFQQVDGTTSRKYGGTGLGLSISRELATLLGGWINVKSSIGQGSTFTLSLPDMSEHSNSALNNAAEDDAQKLPTKPMLAAAMPANNVTNNPTPTEELAVPAFYDDRHHETHYTRTVLVIEDEPDFASILYELAHEMQYRCLVALNAADGVRMATDYLPDAILLDIKLPDASGMSVLQKLKTISSTRHIPVHIVSASDRVQVALQHGAIGYAMKPASREQLSGVFARLEAKFTQKVKRVLLVEDDMRQRESVSDLISSDDIEIVAVESGAEALELLHNSIFDCMIIDLKLPDIQGQELLQRMSNEDIFSFPPVIVYTGRAITRAEEAELQKYARSIIIKGARSPERLLDEVTLFLHKVESELSGERQTILRDLRARDRVLEGRRILLVDDDIRNIFALTSALEQKGAVVEIARDGQEAIAKLNDIKEIDLVLMDVMMPIMDGLEATRQLRSDLRFQKIPIIGITAKAMKDDQEQCLTAGMSDYLAKPIDLDRLYSLLRVWIPQV